ncbi:SDH family Clp fold serine proteinase [Marinobacterium mangrovicola]|uniref:Serine dehydrogenase proteinase n=1 Tax=Marinobacterium mangrovicola TaxID=1476959 RepID=A0A4R1GGQ3_9GAMM|nr:ATP-dependent Clp protease proteolytic subunit [Marinobacterium mangrovicola]TCK06133.1 serine dehydrogenase proteinase [Marinobacterium mangrovicola]
MPSWGGTLEEIQREAHRIQALKETDPSNPEAYRTAPDVVRRKYLAELARHTGRSTIVYASGWLQKSRIASELLMVHQSDLDGFMEAVKACNGNSKGLDLILHSPGGSPEAAEQIVNYLRQKFENIRVIVPHMAMSAATMMACAADEIVMARHSSLGPTDPQMGIVTNTGDVRMVAAHALKADFLAAEEAARNGAFAAWAPIMAQYPPGLLAQCKMSLDLTAGLVKEWLSSYMFAGDKDAEEKASRIADYLADSSHFTHGRPLMREKLATAGLKISDLEEDQRFQELVMSTYHACTHTLGGTIAVKLIESHIGSSYMKVVNPK